MTVLLLVPAVLVSGALAADPVAADPVAADPVGSDPGAADPFVQLDGGYLHTCGLKKSGAVSCWGRADEGQLAAPAGPFLQVSAGLYHSCGLRPGGEVACWGQAVAPGVEEEGGIADTPAVPLLVRVDAAEGVTCGQDAEGRVYCWGQAGRLIAELPRDDAFVQVSIGFSHACALREDHTLACWGEGSGRDHDAPFQAVPPDWPVKAVAVGLGYHSCALRLDDSIGCWGGDGSGDGGNVFAGHLRAPPGRFVALTGGYDHSCALDAQGRATCWGEVASPSSALTFTQLTSGAFHACGLRADGGVTCWGHDQFGQVSRTPEPGALDQGR